MKLLKWWHGVALVAVLGFFLPFNGCTDSCMDVDLEPAQQAFLDSMRIINNFHQPSYVGTYVNDCPSSTIKVFSNNGKKLKRIPRNINALTSLQHIYLVSAGLNSLPDELMELSNIRSGLLDSNHLCNIKPEMEVFLTRLNKYWKERQICP